ncbi:MAG: fused MFS/spermidine synthase, partial [Candidatus Poribacteria bacterium]
MFNYLSWLNIIFSRSESLTDEPKPQQLKFTWKVRLAILGIFFLSGAVGLVYEIIWNRMLTVVFGSTVFAVTTVLTAFMAGMALGSFYIGRYADRHKNPLKIYAYLEIGIGIYALILPLILAGANFIYIFIHRNLGGSFYLLSIFRFILCFIILLIPTTFMGGTLPTMTRAITGKIDRLGWAVGSLYALNTFGAVIGCFMAGFVLIKVMGITATTILSASINIIIALIVLIIFAKREFVFSNENNHKTDKKQDDSVPIELPKNAGKIALLVFGVSGFCALAYEVLWTRILVLFLGSTAYAFATMLSTFLFGIALGSILIAKFADQRKDLLAMLGIIQIVIALSAILLVPTYGRLYDIGLKFKGTGWWAFFISRYSLSFLVMIIPTIFMGATFPIASKIYANSIENLGKSIGKIYSI